ncbi:MAG: Gfo/Idh/MocA family oxidoreductase [Candidatus Sumerlaeota bacterium]|nr:Gfo/Idh/MocA family oxidoreductase [Candidatus Sumerlaeota bacterium]
MTVKLGVVGAGGISKFHFRAFEETKTPVLIIADTNPNAARPYCERFGAKYAASYQEVVAHPEVTAVICCVPSPSHYEISKAALNAGKSVICEKTLTLGSAQSLELARLAEKKGLLLFTSYMKRFFPAAQKAKELMPRIGHVMSVYARTYQGVGADMHTGPLLPFVTKGPDGGASPIVKMSGGGVLVCGGSHILDLMLFLAGKPEDVYGRRLIRPGSDVDILFHALFGLPGGGAAHLEANWHPLKKVGYEGRGWDEMIEISGVNGRLILQTPVWNQPENNAAALRYYDNESETWTDFAMPIVNPFVEAEKFFLRQLASGGQGEMDRYAGYRTDLLIETAWKSSEAGRALAIPWED